jgi:uncharacterized membrane protein YhaH (DUF805 family)
MALCSNCGDDIFGGKVCYKCGTRVGGFVGNSSNVDNGSQVSQQQIPAQMQFQAPVPQQQYFAQQSMGQIPGLPKSMGFTEAIKHCLSNYANFKGRAKRSEYWYFALFCFLAYVISAMVAPALYGIVVVALLLPTFAAGTRRLHDQGKSGANLLWVLVPFGGIVVIIWLASAGDSSLNKYS